MMTIQQACELAMQQQRNGRLEEARALYRQILGVQPNHTEAWYYLGDIYAKTGMLDEAIAQYRRALLIRPDFAEALNNLGITLARAGRLDEAFAVLRQAIEVRPDYPEAQNNFGIILAENGRFDEAIAAFGRALQSKPASAEMHMNLGNALRNRGELEKSIESYRCAFRFRPDYADAFNNLGIALAGLGRIEEAVAAHRSALKWKPDAVEFHNNLGAVLAEQGRFDDAMEAFRGALKIEPSHAATQNSMGNCFRDQGRFDEAVAAYRRALEIKPDQPVVHSNLIYTLHFHPHQDVKVIIEEQRRWNRQFSEPVKGLIPLHANSRDTERRLRLGYVSPDFRDHVVGRNLLPLFKRHDHERFEIICYSGTVREDKFTAEIRGCADRWRSTVGVTDDKLAGIVWQDEVDILVDLSQHMAGNRLPLFARKTAPVQASFAGYPESAGIEAIEYRISDRWLEPEARDGGGKEQVQMLDSFWCYDPCEMDMEVNELPARESGRITFGNLNNFCKVNETILRLWAQVLQEVKDSRLMLLCGFGSHRQRTQEFLEQEGIASHRVELLESCSRRAYLEYYHRLDVVLDTFPYNGHTTSLDALWMGVPVVSLSCEHAVSRAGLSQLSNLGLRELVALSGDEYVEIAGRLAHDLPRLAEMRRTLRGRMEASVLMDAGRFAYNIETAYRAMWRQWCTGRSDP